MPVRQVLLEIAEMVLAPNCRGIALVFRISASVMSSFCSPAGEPGVPTVVSPVRTGNWPVRRRPATRVQLGCA